MRGERLYRWLKGECIVLTAAMMIQRKNYFLLIIIEIILIVFIKKNAAVPYSISKAVKNVLTDIRPTDLTTDDGPFGLKIYFTDEGNDDMRSKETTDNDNDEHDAENDNKLHKLLLTSIEEKQVNSRHELYKNPQKPEIKFRTESPASLKTVASPLLVQNSVKNKLIENTKRRLKKKRGERDKRSGTKKAQDKATTTSNIWPKSFSVNGASWFKRYQALYNDMLKRNGKGAVTNYKAQPPIDYYHYGNQIATATTQRNALSGPKYYFNYVYPLYHLHSTENQGQFANQNHMRKKPLQTMKWRSRNVVPGVYPLRNPLQLRDFRNQFKNNLPSSTNQHQASGQNQNIASRNLLQERNKYFQQNTQNNGARTEANTLTYNGRRMSFVKTLPKPKKEYKPIPNNIKVNGDISIKDPALQNIGIRDDASFMEASPNYDSSMLTLHTMQSLIPKAQVKSMIPQIKQTPMITAKDLGTKSKWSGLTSNRYQELHNPLKNDMGMSGRRQMNMKTEETSSKKLLLTNSDSDQKVRKIYTQRSEIIRPISDKITQTQNGITLSFYKERQKPRVEFPPENENVKRDVIYKNVSPLSDIDSDDVTAENLAAIFSELDGRIDDVLLQDKVAKKDSVARPQPNDVSRPQDEIEMTVYDTSKGIPFQKPPGVNFVNVTRENETNFQETLEMQDIEKDNKIGSIKETIIRPGFDLKRLHFGLRNGNTFD